MRELKKSCFEAGYVHGSTGPIRFHQLQREGEGGREREERERERREENELAGRIN